MPQKRITLRTMIQRIKSNLLRLKNFQNRYLLTGCAALFWVTFISDIDLIYLVKSKNYLMTQERQVEHYERSIRELYVQLEDLSSNPERLERFAREHYFMKRDNEDLFRILPMRDESD